MKVRHEDWEGLKTAQVVEHVWLDRATKQNQSSEHWTSAQPGEQGCLA